MSKLTREDIFILVISTLILFTHAGLVSLWVNLAPYPSFVLLPTLIILLVLAVNILRLKIVERVVLDGVYLKQLDIAANLVHNIAFALHVICYTLLLVGKFNF